MRKKVNIKDNNPQVERTDIKDGSSQPGRNDVVDEGPESDIVRCGDEIDKLNKQAKIFDDRITTLESEINNTDKFLSEVKETQEKYNEEYSNVKTKCDELSKALDNKADKSSIDVYSIDVIKIRRKHERNTCLFFCGITVLNIIAIWLIIYRPGSSMNTLSWYYSIPLVADTLVNMIATAIWIHDFIRENKPFFKVNRNIRKKLFCAAAVLEIFTEIALSVFSTVAIWLFSAHPQRTIASVIVALIILLTFATGCVLCFRATYYVGKLGTSQYRRKTRLYFIVSAIGTALCLAIFIIFVGWIRV